MMPVVVHKKEPLLLQTDHVTRYDRQNLVSCCTTAEKNCTANAQEIKVMELEGYS